MTNGIGKIVAIALVAIAAVSYWAYSFIGGSENGAPMDELTREERLAGKMNIVVLGVDERSEENDTGRSDTLFVAMLDSEKNNLALLSVPRDTRVRIPKYGWDKINHAFAFGGHKLTQATTEQLLGIRIDNYVMINFKGFKELVDAIGGIDIEVEAPMSYYDEWDGFTIDLAPGMQHMNGVKAIQYVRYRDEEGDIGRIRRQQKFMRAVYRKVTSLDILPRLPALTKQIYRMVDTDLSITDMLMLAKAVHGMADKSTGISMATVPGVPEYIDDISYWIPDITDLRAQMVEMQDAKMTEKYRLGAEKMEAEYKRSLEQAKETVKEDNKKEKAKDSDSKLKAKKEQNAKDGDIKSGKKGQINKAKKAVQENKAPEAVAKQERVQQKTTVSGVVRVVVIDCGNSPANAAAVGQRLSNLGGVVVIDGGSGAERAETLIVATTTSGRVVSKLSTAPFPHGMSISRREGVDYDAIVYVGTDFR